MTDNDDIVEVIDSLYCHRPCSWHPKCDRCQGADLVKAEIERLGASQASLVGELSAANEQIERLRLELKRFVRTHDEVLDKDGEAHWGWYQEADDADT